jgi:plasmid stabilization system protein ParE
MDEQFNKIVGFVLDNPEEAAREILELRAALQAYVDEAKSHSSQGKPDSPFRLRLVAAEKALKLRDTP